MVEPPKRGRPDGDRRLCRWSASAPRKHAAALDHDRHIPSLKSGRRASIQLRPRSSSIRSSRRRADRRLSAAVAVRCAGYGRCRVRLARGPVVKTLTVDDIGQVVRVLPPGADGWQTAGFDLSRFMQSRLSDQCGSDTLFVTLTDQYAAAWKIADDS